jgi:GxxExxY protein
LLDRGLNVQRQKPIDITFNNKTLKEGFRADLIVENKVLIEIKSVEKIIPVHHAQILSYLKMTNLRLGYLINFNDTLLKNGLKRFVKRK